MVSRLAAACLASAVLLALPAGAQTYPAKTVRIVMPWTPGGATDILSRTLAQKLGEEWKQQVVVDNRPGGNGIIGTELAARAAPDGHTLLMGATGPNSVLPTLMTKLPYDALKDFDPVTLVATTTYVLSVHPSMPVGSVQELVKLGKSRPGEFTFASPGTGTPNHLSGEMFKSMTGIDMRHVPYKGSAPAMTDVMGGQVTLTFENIAPVLPYIKAGKLKALGITAGRRSPLLQDVPTISESGLPGFEAVGWFGLLTPAGTPKDVIAKVNAAVGRALRLPDVHERLTALGVELYGGTVQEFDAFQKAQMEKWARVIREAHVRLE